MKKLCVLIFILATSLTFSQDIKKDIQEEEIYQEALLQYFNVIDYFQGKDFYLYKNEKLIKTLPKYINGFSIKNLEENSNLNDLLEQFDFHILAIHFSDIKEQDSFKFIKVYDVFINLNDNKIDVNFSKDHSMKIIFKLDIIRNKYDFLEISFD